MNGAESLVRTLVAGDVDVCFTNPGTSEMHFVAALDRVEGMRCVSACSKAGPAPPTAISHEARRPRRSCISARPANGLANLHNAKKANSGIVNIVGQHATHHIGHNAPLTSDIEAWRGRCRPGADLPMPNPSPPTAWRDRAAKGARRRPSFCPPTPLERRRYAQVPAESQRANYSVRRGQCREGFAWRRL
jgi:acetolactate synthase-1/2/3 large subunit